MLRIVQQTAEEGCYAFARAHLPQLLKNRKWTCAEAAELQDWARALPPLLVHLGSDIVKEVIDWSALRRATGPSFQRPSTIWQDVIDLRHSAVHRITMSPATLISLVGAASNLMRLLKDIKRHDWLEELLVELDDALRNPDGGMRAVERFISEQRIARREELRTLAEKEVSQLTDTDSMTDLAQSNPVALQSEKRPVGHSSSPNTHAAMPLREEDQGRAPSAENGLEAPEAASAPAVGQGDASFWHGQLESVGACESRAAGSAEPTGKIPAVQADLDPSALGPSPPTKSAPSKFGHPSLLGQHATLESFGGQTSPSKLRAFTRYNSAGGEDKSLRLAEPFRRPDRAVSSPGSSKWDPIVIDDGSPKKGRSTRLVSAGDAPSASAGVEEDPGRSEDVGKREAEEDTPWWEYVLARL